MTPTRALFILVTLSGVAIAATSCGGDDEAVGPQSGGAGGGLIDGGTDSGGSAGSRAGSGGTGGSGGSGGSVTTGTRLGQACVNDTECDPDDSTGLTCMTATETNLDGTAPPRGLCTVECSTHETCWAIDGNGLCVQFGSTNYCVEGCFQGEPTDPLAPAKCHNRVQFACTPLDTFPIDQTCVDITDCPTGHACYMSECVVVLAACLPACTGDQDCAEGMFCDRDLGTCTTESTAGEPLGTACDPDATTDPCSGFCQTITDLPMVDGMCAEGCSFLNPCDYDAEGNYRGACLFSTAVNDEPDIGDFGFCSQLCDCSAQCATPGFGCIEIDGLNDFYGRPGLCLYPFEEDGGMSVTLENCPGGGSGGTGGTNGTAGEGGAGN